jgi:hypothetical protein
MPPGNRSEIASPVSGMTVTSTEELLVAVAGGRFSVPCTIIDADGGWAAFVAVIVTLVEDATEGAVNKPLSEIEPALVFHTTAVFGVDVRVATNCCLAPEAIVALEGETAIPIEVLGIVLGVEEGATPLQPVEMQARAEMKIAIPACL